MALLRTTEYSLYSNISTILSAGIYSIQAGVVNANNGAVNINNTTAAAIFLVAIGGWNYSQLFTVMAANGSAPKKKILASFIDNTNDFPVSAYGNWGFTITNNTGYNANYKVYKITKE